MTQRVTWTARDTNKQVSLSGSVPEIIEECDRIEARAKWRRPLLIGLFVVLTAGGFIVAVALADLWLYAVAPLVVFAGGMAVMRVGTTNIEARKLETIRTLLWTFADEMRPGRPVEVSLDFRGYWRFKAGESWLTVKMTLANGVTAQITGRSTNKRKTKRKGGYLRTKDKLTEFLVVRLGPPKGQTLDAGLRIPVMDHPLGPLSLRQVKVRPRAATFVFSTKQILRNAVGGYWAPTDRTAIPQGRDAVKALITSYQLLARAGGQAAAAAG